MSVISGFVSWSRTLLQRDISRGYNVDRRCSVKAVSSRDKCCTKDAFSTTSPIHRAL